MGDFDVSPGWRRTLIAEGGSEERVVWVQRSVDELRTARAQHFHLFPRIRLEVLTEDVVAAVWMGSGKCVNRAYIDGEAASQWMKFKRSISGCCLLRM